MNEKEIQSVEEFIKKLPQEKINEINKIEIEKTKIQYEKFKNRFSKGECIFCDSNIKSFNKDVPCLHWLLIPQGFRKKHFKIILENFNYYRIDSYLRWIANQEVFLKNINDLTEERRDSRIFEYTIKYKNIEYTFSCSKGDIEGHKNSRFGKRPHYHLQIRKDNKQFVDFSDFHITLTDYDLFTIKSRRGEIKGISPISFFGEGMNLFEHLDPEEILKNAKITDDEDERATFHTSYILEAEPGTTISGDDLANLFEESKKTGTPMWNLLPRLKNVKSKAIISPHDSVVKIAQRKGGRGKNGT